MNLQFQLDNFETLIDASNGTDALRTTVIELAISGELVPHEASEGSASDLLQRIRSQLGAKARKESRRVSSEASSELRHSVPAGWQLVRFPDIAAWAIGSGFPTRFQGHTDKEYMFCKVGDMNLVGNERFINSTNNTIDEDIRTQAKVKIHHAGTVIFPKIGGAIATNKRRILVADTAIDNNCLGLTPYPGVSSAWLFVLLSSLDLSKYQSGTSVPALSQAVLETITFGLPPTKEQHRIVAKVDELMALIDRFEAAKNAREDSRKAFRDSALQALQDATDADEVQKAWKLVADNMDDMFVEPEDVEAAVETVQTLAASGRLIPSHDYSVSNENVVREILGRRETASKRARTRKPEPVVPISQDEKYPAPAHWSWVRLGWLLRLSSGKSLKRSDMNPDGNIPVFGGNGVAGFTTEANVDKPTLVIGRVGAYCGSVHLTDGPSWVTDNALMISQKFHDWDDEFLALVLRVRNLNLRSKSTGQPLITAGGVYPEVFALPPIAEQHEIVQRLALVLGLLGDLRDSMTKNRTRQAELASSTMASITCS